MIVRRDSPRSALRALLARRRSSDRGSVTAEAAITIPAMVMVALLLLGFLGVVSSQQACADAARQAARVLARGESVPAATQLVRAVAPQGARLRSSVGEEWVTARVSVDVRVGVGRLGTTVEVSEASTAAREGVW